MLRAGLTWQQVAVLRATRSTCGRRVFPTASRTSRRWSTTTPQTARSLVELFEALFDPHAADECRRRDAQAAAAAVAADIDALVSLDTDRVLRAFASLIQATLRTNYFVTRHGFGAPRRTCCRSSSIPG